jgi:hypothetical protein
MRGTPEARPIVLTADERAELDALRRASYNLLYALNCHVAHFIWPQ